METAPLKSFAAWARTALIREVAARIAVVLAPASPERVEQPSPVAALERAVRAAGGGDSGRAAVAEKVAYTWFNRIIALRFMDANGYTGIGVVSPERGREGGQPEVLAEAKRGNIDSMVITNKRTTETVTSLLNGNRRSDDPQGEAYALLLAEYCRYWNRSMPFMFEREGDYTELLIPANLLADDSVRARAVAVLTEEVCQDVEVIGWLYQFYISERKDEVFAGFKKGKKAGAAEIPAATQLFTPHWIVRYLVENSLGHLWLLNRPASRLAKQMEYYIAPVGEETDFLKVTSPEELKIIDPACGSGHMLTYAFDLLYAIYEEEGYAPFDIPGLILANNLFGTEIDPRAGSLAAFALTMKARACQRTFFNKQVQPNICVLEPISFTATELDALVTPDIDRLEGVDFWNQFRQADVFGSLILPRQDLIEPLRSHLDENNHSDGDLLTTELRARARRVIGQTEYLSKRYHVVVANPPYMGSVNMGGDLSDFAKSAYGDSKSDLFAMFIQRCTYLAIRNAYIGMVTMHSWMFLRSFRALRGYLRAQSAPACFAHLGTRAFSELGGEVVSTVAFALRVAPDPSAKAPFTRLVEVASESDKARALREEASVLTARSHVRSWGDLSRLPDGVISYWLTEAQVKLLTDEVPLAEAFPIMAGISTGDNNRYFRLWPEVSAGRILCGDSSGPWVPHHKGGPERRWYGNVSHVLRYDAESVAEMERLPGFRHDGNASYFLPHIGWSALTSAAPSFRYIDKGHTFGSGSKALVANERQLLLTLGVLNSWLSAELLEGMSPTLNFEVGHIGRLPTLPTESTTSLGRIVEEIIAIAREEWDEQETSFGFRRSPLLRGGPGSLREAVQQYVSDVRDRSNRLSALEGKAEVEVRRAFGVDMPAEFGKTTAANVSGRPVDDLLSFAVGCMFGRYSLDEPGLILANQGSTLEDYLERIPNPSFTPDKDNVIPIVEGDWFEDDIVGRFRQFLRVAFGEQYFQENLRFVNEMLRVKDLRDYFVKSFYKDHVQRYKKRPIYWLFSSPKGSFNALIYMHRYTPSTASIVLNEYLREFKAKLEASRQHHERLAAGGGTPREKAAAQKEADRLRMVLLELDEYERDVLYPLATQQVQIGLDDGVKANYPKFGTALKRIPGLEANDE
jgi:hypothetical protein